MNTDIIVEKSKLGDMWKITDGNKIHITNQAGLEKFLAKRNERQKQS